MYVQDVGDREENVKAWLCRADANYQDKLLACGAVLVAQLRVKVLEETQFTCSAGIAHNKMLAKLVSGMHKPAQQTVVPSSSVQDFLASLPVKKMKQLGGKLGSSLQDDLGVKTVGDLLGFTEEKLQEYYGVNTGTWLWKTARGFSGEEVEDRLLPKSHGCGKTFPGPKALKNHSSVKSWLDKLCEELSERIQSDLSCNKRVAQTLTLHARASKENECNSMKKFPSKSCPLRYGTGKIQEDAMKLFESGLHDFWGSRSARWSITSLSVTASKIFDIPSGTNSILKYIKGPSSNASTAILDSSSTPELTPFVGNVTQLNIADFHEEQCEPSSIKEECDNSISATQCRLIEGKGAPKKLSKVQGTGSILKFLSQSQPAQHEKRNFDGLICSHQGPESSSGASVAEQHGRDNINTAVDHSSGSGDTWMLNVEDIDPDVVGELPLEIQREIQGWIRPSKQATPKKRGSTISSYFSPARR
uniref:DNA polymerase eta n=1 Tax=Aegilops tauschii subsp. strangulata TaxID=200361 RepID=A0A453FJI2_AEGTS